MGACLADCYSDTFGDTRVFQLSQKRCLFKKRLAEGGFSFVDVVEDLESGRIYAMKRIICSEEQEVKKAVKEVDTYRQFNSPYIVPVLDSIIIDSRAGTTEKEVLILFPFYENGTLQDKIEDMGLTGSYFPEPELWRIFRGICQGVRQLHRCRPPLSHRDIKLANVLLDANNDPILTDFGSVDSGEVNITNRHEAIFLQDVAAQNSSLPYRAPELVEVPSRALITTKTDIWALGCALYTMAYHQTPFELASEHGGSLPLAIAQGKIKFPASDRYSKELRSLISQLLKLDPVERPNIDELMIKVDSILAKQGKSHH